MSDQIVITVEWFDELKGIGEGKSSSGDVVFLNSDCIVSNNRFLTLKAGEKVLCEVQRKDQHFYASKIVRNLEKNTDVEHATFITPAPLNKTPDSVI